jgi:hypothetical protein
MQVFEVGQELSCILAQHQACGPGRCKRRNHRNTPLPTEVGLMRTHSRHKSSALADDLSLLSSQRTQNNR